MTGIYKKITGKENLLFKDYIQFFISDYKKFPTEIIVF